MAIPANKKFEDFVRLLGFGLAVVVAKATLSPDFWKRLTLVQIVQVYQAALRPDPELATTMFRRVKRTMESFATVSEALLIGMHKEMHDVLVKRLFNTAKTFGQYRVVFEADPDSNLGKLAFRRLAKNAMSKQEKAYVAKHIDPGSPYYEELMIGLERVSLSFSDELEIWELNPGKPLGKRAWQRMMRVGNFNDWFNYLKKQPPESLDLDGSAFARCLVLVGQDFAKYKKLMKLMPSSMLATLRNELQVVDARLYAAASNFDQRFVVLTKCHTLSAESQGTLLRSLCDEATTVERCIRLYEAKLSSFYEVRVLDRLRELYASN